MSDPAKREDFIRVGGSQPYARCDSIFAPWRGLQPKQCVRIRGHEGHHCDEDGKQWKS